MSKVLIQISFFTIETVFNAWSEFSGQNVRDMKDSDWDESTKHYLDNYDGKELIHLVVDQDDFHFETTTHLEGWVCVCEISANDEADIKDIINKCNKVSYKNPRLHEKNIIISNSYLHSTQYCPYILDEFERTRFSQNTMPLIFDCDLKMINDTEIGGAKIFFSKEGKNFIAVKGKDYYTRRWHFNSETFSIFKYLNNRTFGFDSRLKEKAVTCATAINYLSDGASINYSQVLGHLNYIKNKYLQTQFKIDISVDDQLVSMCRRLGYNTNLCMGPKLERISRFYQYNLMETKTPHNLILSFILGSKTNLFVWNNHSLNINEMVRMFSFGFDKYQWNYWLEIEAAGYWVAPDSILFEKICNEFQISVRSAYNLIYLKKYKDEFISRTAMRYFFSGLRAVFQIPSLINEKTYYQSAVDKAKKVCEEYDNLVVEEDDIGRMETARVEIEKNIKELEIKGSLNFKIHDGPDLKKALYEESHKPDRIGVDYKVLTHFKHEIHFHPDREDEYEKYLRETDEATVKKYEDNTKALSKKIEQFRNKIDRAMKDENRMKKTTVQKEVSGWKEELRKMLNQTTESHEYTRAKRNMEKRMINDEKLELSYAQNMGYLEYAFEEFDKRFVQPIYSRQAVVMVCLYHFLFVGPDYMKYLNEIFSFNFKNYNRFENRHYHMIQNLKKLKNSKNILASEILRENIFETKMNKSPRAKKSKRSYSTKARSRRDKKWKSLKLADLKLQFFTNNKSRRVYQFYLFLKYLSS